MAQHVCLLIEDRGGRPIVETVHAEPLGNGHYKLLHSPGLVQGIAAGDEFRFTGVNGAFEVLSRAGNIVVQLYADADVEPFAAEVDNSVRAIGGALDGIVTRGMVFTIPVGVGFEAIERLFNTFVADKPGVQWIYGNVYVDAQGRVPLNWWNMGRRRDIDEK